MIVLKLVIFSLVLWSATIECDEITSVPLEEELADDSSIETRVVGGRDAQTGSIPYIASLQLGTWHSCGGSIIGKQWILTAAHCVVNYTPEDYNIRVGTTKHSEPGPYYLADRIYTHCSYNEPIFENDIALIHLTEPIEYNDLVQPVKLPIKQHRTGESVKLSGWGQLADSLGVPDHLQTVDLQFKTATDCKKFISSDFIGDGNVCAMGPDGTGACYGDSGGPLVSADGYLVGVANWVFPCALGRPDAYANTWYYRDWINRVMSGNINCGDKAFTCDAICMA